jgi:hypothetical protein
MLRIFIASAVITVTIGLTFALTGRADGHLLQASGTLKPDAQVFYPLPQLKRGELLSISAIGSGGDLDCYILIKGPSDKVWHILALDERETDSCSIRIYPQTDFPSKLWLRNNGSKNDSFSVVLDR